jgi:carboxyl-terminal processing protease
VGTQTYGKGSVQNAIDLDKVIAPSLKDKLLAIAGKAKTVATGSQNKFGQLNLTIAKFYRINGSSTQHKGVMPDIVSRLLSRWINMVRIPSHLLCRLM